MHTRVLRWGAPGATGVSNVAAREAAEIDQEGFQALLIGLLAGGALLVMLNEPLAGSFARQALIGKQPAVLGLLLALCAVAAIAASKRSPALGNLAAIASAFAVSGLAVYWLPTPARAMLWILPAILAVSLLGALPSLLATVTAGVLAWGVGAGQPVGEQIAGLTCVILAVLWGARQVGRGSLQRVLVSYQSYFEQAQARLEEARDDRLQVRQLNEDLADAYGQLRRLNELLRASKLEAEVARRVKEEFVAKVSHELRTPLNMIIGFSEMIIHAPDTYGDKLPTALLSDIGVIYRNSQHLLQLINDVLVLSQVESSQFSLNRTWADLDVIVHEAAQAVEPLFMSKRLELTLELPTEPVRILCDELRIRQVLLNLLSNAGRYTAEGGVTVTVAHAAGQATVAVADTGPGIAGEDQKRIFEPFQQTSETAQRANAGTGLGLSISKHLIEAHSGRMWLESAPECGSTFFFTLPECADAPGVPVATGFRVNPYSAYSGDARRALPVLPSAKARIVVLEHNGVIGQQLAGYLAGMEVNTTATLEALAAACRARPPAAILINDASAMDDRAFSRQLINVPDRTPILSCYLPGKEEACARFNVVDFLVKPVTREALVAVVEGIVGEGSTILCVEDDPEMARLIRRQLTAAPGHYRILHAADGAGALALMRSRQPDLVLMDLGLPDQDGYVTLAQKNEEPAIREVPVVIVSARDPVGGPVVTGRLRVELAGGLSVRDIAALTEAVSRTFSHAPSAHPARLENDGESPVSGGIG